MATARDPVVRTPGRLRRVRVIPGTMPVMQQLPAPCPVDLIPDVTHRFDAAYRAAKGQRAVFVGIEREGERWTVKTDALTAGPGHVVHDAVNVALRAAVARLVSGREAGPDAFAGPVYFMLHGVPRGASPRARRGLPCRTVWGSGAAAQCGARCRRGQVAADHDGAAVR